MKQRVHWLQGKGVAAAGRGAVNAADGMCVSPLRGALCARTVCCRLVTCEADKTIKMWREDANATEETHPINFVPPKDIKRF